MSENSAFETEKNSSAFETNESAFEIAGESSTDTVFATSSGENSTNSAYETADGNSTDSAYVEANRNSKDSAFAETDRNSFPVEEKTQKQIAIESLVVTDVYGNHWRLSDLYSLSEKGAMGEVYKATLEINGGRSSRTVLFKRSNPSPSKEELQLFTNESQLSCEKGGGNIIKGLCYGEYEGRPFLITEFYEGTSLKKKIEQGDYKSKFYDATNVALGILEGLERLERDRIVHRDLKPANIIIRNDGNPVIIDLGLARQESFADLKLKKVGTEKYAAPEQMQNGTSTYASDIYAVGLIFLEMLTGATNLSAMNDFPENICFFIEKCCKEDPEKRFQSAREARSRLARICESLLIEKHREENFAHKKLSENISDSEEESLAEKNVSAEKLSEKKTPKSKASVQKSNRGSLVGIAAVAVFSILCFVFYPKGGDVKQTSNPINPKAELASVVKETAPEAQPNPESKPAETEVPQPVGFTKPANFDETKEFFDTRDGRVYKLLSFVGKTWLVGNLTYAGQDVSFAKCYQDANSCDEFGRLYNYESAQKACPTGFRLPTQQEWELVLNKVGKKGAGKLRIYDGFAALSAGYYQKAVDSFFLKGEFAGWWVGDSEENGQGMVFNMLRNDPMMISKENLNDAYSVRCIKE